MFAVSGPFGPTYSANLLIMVLILAFLTVPVILLLIDAQKQKKAKARVNPQAILEEPHRVANIRGQETIPANKAMQVIHASQVRNNFARDRPGEVVAYLPPLMHVMGPVQHRGYLQIAPNTIVEGDIRVAGSLALGTGAEVYGDIEVSGELYLAPAGLVTGRAHIVGDVYLDRWSEVGDLETASQIHLGRGASIARNVRAERVTYDLLESIIPEAVPHIMQEAAAVAAAAAALEEPEEAPPLAET